METKKPFDATKYQEYEEYFSQEHSSSFQLKSGVGGVMISAPHAVEQTRNGRIKCAESQTGALAKMLHEQLHCPIIYKTKNMGDDANYDEAVSVITQNIDGLHEKAGSKAIANIHGSLANFYCDECGAHHFPVELIYEGQYDSLPDCVPRCTECSGSALIRPNITLYGEGLPAEDWQLALHWTRQADLFIVVGSSLTVSPANLIPHYFGRDDKLVVINRDFVPVAAELVFNEDICEVFENIKVPQP